MDIGAHVQFSHYDWFDQAMLDLLGPDGWTHHDRRSWIWMGDRMVPYPLQNNIHLLAPDDIERCVLGLLELVGRPRSTPVTFADWVDANFGEGLAEVFMRRYNEKVWAHPLSALNAAWVGERVAVPDLRRIIGQLVRGTEDTGWGPNATFAFPRRGGTGAIWTEAAARLPQANLAYGERVVTIDLVGHRCTTSQGRTIGYGSLISTMPLRDLIVASGQDQLRPAADDGLLWSASNIVGLGMTGQPPEHLQGKSWIYFPEDIAPFYRATVFSNFAPLNVPEASSQSPSPPIGRPASCRAGPIALLTATPPRA